jgi:sulfopyruvate decarboxylase TPP-binding subunit
MIFSPAEIASRLEALQVSDVVWVPDSTFGTWESALTASKQLRLLRVCREGEAWPLAAGLYLGGRSPLVVMQSTGFFESGDALRNVIFDLQIPVLAIVGARNWLVVDSPDSARQFILPVLKAWAVDCAIIATPHEKERLEAHLIRCRLTNRPGIILLAEGQG